MPELNRDLLRRLRDDIDATLEKISTRHGVTLKTSG